MLSNVMLSDVMLSVAYICMLSVVLQSENMLVSNTVILC